MYDYIKGTLISKNTAGKIGMVVENNAVGYVIESNIRTLSSIGEINEQVKIFTSLVHKEDTMMLCGFVKKEDRDIFNILQSVSGIGVKVALVLLDEFSGYDLISAVIKEDSTTLSRAKGVGPKLAKKIILELKDKLITWQNITPIDLSDVLTQNLTEESTEAVSDAQAVLLSLGYSVNEAKSAIKHSIAVVDKIKSSEEILKEALRFLAK